MNSSDQKLPPVIIIGGDANPLSVARSLGGRGIKVYSISEPHEYIRYSRFCEWIPVKIQDSVEESWARYLIGPESDHLRGAVLLSGCDAGIQIIAKNREKLQQKFLLDDSNPQAQLCMLDKLCTYRQAQAAGVATPRFWSAETREQIMAVKDELVYPLIVKPLLSHIFEPRFGRKFVVVNDFDQLLDAYETVSGAGIETMLVEMIQGPDDRLCSYYTYMDENGEPAFDFTKRIIRRFPTNMGPACYHVTDRNPEVREQALKLFKFVKLRGLANAEFKRDERDGQLKLIECNARFTAANCLVAASGFDLALFVYNRLTGRPQEPLETYVTGKRLWYPIRDFHAFRDLRKKGQLTFRQWAASLAHPQVLPYFRWHDPMPTVVTGLREIKKMLTRRIRRASERVEVALHRRREEAMPGEAGPV